MTQDEIIRFAIQCRLVTTGNRDGIYMDALTKFANLVAAKEREACAKACDSLNFIDNGTPAGTRSTNRHCAAAIRARGEA
jgi:hypothetical protein